MEKIIDALIQIEDQARLITDEAEKEQKNLSKIIAAETEKIRQRVEEETRETIKRRQDAALLQSGQKAEAVLLEAKSRAEAMKGDFERFHEGWENEIFARITER